MFKEAENHSLQAHKTAKKNCRQHDYTIGYENAQNTFHFLSYTLFAMPLSVVFTTPQFYSIPF